MSKTKELKRIYEPRQNYHVSFGSRLPCERLSFQRGVSSLIRASDSPRSREISTKVGVDSALRNMVSRGVHNTKTHSFMGVDSAVVCLSVVLSTPQIHAIWRCETPPSQPMFRVQR